MWHPKTKKHVAFDESGELKSFRKPSELRKWLEENKIALVRIDATKATRLMRGGFVMWDECRPN